MVPQLQSDGEKHSLVARYPITSYFCLTFAISWLGAFAVASPHLLRHETLPRITGILMFPAMLLGPSLSGIVLTAAVSGRKGLRDLGVRVGRARVGVAGYAALLVAPIAILSILCILRLFVSPVYQPNFFFAGIVFAVPAGTLEEIGWMGFAFPRLRQHSSLLGASVALGLLWSLWHLPVINFLGTAVPHGAYWFRFFLAFTVAMTAMRVLIAQIYSVTQSVLLTQFMHICSTGSLVMFSPPSVTPSQESGWYFVYGVILWVMTLIFGRVLKQREAKPRPPNALDPS
jgi:membrane protease YdiL (CAAX protease family)